MADQVLQIRSLDAFYGDFQALFSLDLEVASDGVIAIIGANGAGKSTLMRSISGMLQNQPDSVLFHGQPIGGLRADQIAAKGIALVPEGRQLFPSLSVEENLIIGGRMRRPGPWSLAAVYDLFPILQERRHQASTSLSGGQQQMVAIGRALMANPSLLMFDEISLGLAPVIIRQIYEVLPKIIATGMSAIIVEQDISKALEVSSHVYCLQEGRVSLSGKSAEITREQISEAYFGARSDHGLA